MGQLASVTPADASADLPNLGTAVDACDESCNAHTRASLRARQLARSQVPADLIEAVLVCELGLTDAEAADLVTDLVPILLVESRCGRGQLGEYLWRLGQADPELVRTATSTSLAAATLLARHHLGLDGIGPDEKVRKLLQQAEIEAARHIERRPKRGGLSTIAGGRAA